MSTFAFLGIILLVASILLFAYQVMTAFMQMGTSNEFTFENISLADILDVSAAEWSDGISIIYLQGLAETLLTMPLAILLLAGAIFFFLIHAFTSEKQIRKK